MQVQCVDSTWPGQVFDRLWKVGGRTIVMNENLTDDVLAVGRIEAVSGILEVVCRTMGMGFAAVARVTESRWIACAVRDEIEWGQEE